MRRVKYVCYTGKSEISGEGVLLDYGIDYDELTNGVGMFSVGIIEKDDGAIVTAAVENITFIQEA